MSLNGSIYLRSWSIKLLIEQILNSFEALYSQIVNPNKKTFLNYAGQVKNHKSYKIEL